MHRLTGDHISTFVGFAAATLGVVFALCTVVGLAVVVDLIAGWV